MNIPKFYDLMTPVLRVLENLGGTAPFEIIAEEIVESLELPKEEACSLYKTCGARITKIEHNVAYAAKYLCSYGVIEKVEPNVWALTDKYEPGMVVTHENILDAAKERLMVRSKFGC